MLLIWQRTMSDQNIQQCKANALCVAPPNKGYKQVILQQLVLEIEEETVKAATKYGVIERVIKEWQKAFPWINRKRGRKITSQRGGGCNCGGRWQWRRWRRRRGRMNNEGCVFLFMCCACVFFCTCFACFDGVLELLNFLMCFFGDSTYLLSNSR